MEILSATQMQLLDKCTMFGGITSRELMERAGREFFRYFQKINTSNKKVLIVVGNGNNGGDALVVARYLKRAKRSYTLLFLKNPQQFQGELAFQFSLLNESKYFIWPQVSGLPTCDVIVDGLFGTGLSRSPSGLIRKLISWLNSLDSSIYSIDMPSGFDANKGRPYQFCVRAHQTITFEYPKKGFFNPKYKSYVGKIAVVSIGLDKKCVSELKVSDYVINRDMVLPVLLSKRSQLAHKGTCGHVGIIGGSTNKMGAALLAGLGALKAGAGRVTIYLPETAYFKLRVPNWELMFDTIPDDGSGYFCQKFSQSVLKTLKNKHTALVIGPGMGQEVTTRKFIFDILNCYEGNTVIDADALNALATVKNWKSKIASQFCVLTPHPKEFERLSKTKYNVVSDDRENFLRKFVEKSGLRVILKGANSIYVNPEKVTFINPTGTPAMANAGQGDYLSGLISGIVSEHGPSDLSVLAALFWHGLQSNYLSYKNDDRVTLVTDMAAKSQRSLNWLSKNKSLFETEF